MNGVALLATFGLIFVAELPDKTMMATLVLSSRYRPLPVLVGVCAAFLVQTVIAVAAGGLLRLLPQQAVLAVVAILFAVGAVLLYRESMAEDDDDEDGNGKAVTGFGRIALTSFLVLFVAEWGDASQLGTAALSARYGDPVAVFIGAFAALATIATIAVLLGRVIVRYIPLTWIQRGAAVQYAVFAVEAGYEAIFG